MALNLARPNSFGGNLLQTFVLATMLGGLRGGGPVKSFSGRKPRLPLITDESQDGTHTLDLDGRAERRNRIAYALDERDREQRDHAHYVAYRIVRWALCMAATLGWAAWFLLQGRFVALAPALLWLVALLALSLPQAVILWTEPDSTADEGMRLA